MRRLLYILLMVTTLAGVFGSCRHTPGEAEEQLIAIDSLITIEPDSALAQLEAINADSLPADLRAYHDLLVTQAMYKAYVPASTDTLITRALRYYADHGPYDRRIRAMLYRGTVEKELGRPDSAMRWFKRCEREISDTDYYNLGFVHLRMAYLYQFQFVFPERAIALHKKAYQNFIHCGDAKYQLTCLTELGIVNRLVNGDSAIYYSNKAIRLALQLNDSIQLCKNYESLAGYYLELENWQKAKEYSMKVIQSGSTNSVCYYMISQSFLHLNNSDSAWYYFNKAESPTTTRDSVLYYRTLSDLLYDQGDYKASAKNSDLAGDVSGNAIIAQSRFNYSSIEEEFENDVLSIDNQNLTSHIKLIWLLVAISIVAFSIAIIILLATFLKIRAKQRHIKHTLRMANEEIKLLNEKLDSRQSEISYNDSVSERYKNIIHFQSSCTKLLFNSTVYSGIKGTSIFKYLFDMEESKNKMLVRIKLPEKFWIDLDNYICLTFPNAFTNLENGGIILSDKERKLIMLDCLHVPNAVIAIILEYAEFSTASMRNRLISKLGGNGKTLYQIMECESSK